MPATAEIVIADQPFDPKLDPAQVGNGIVALGRVAHETVVTAQSERRAAHPFAHGGTRPLGAFMLFDSYHCSRYNQNTGRLTEAMFEAVFARATALRDLTESERHSEV